MATYKHTDSFGHGDAESLGAEPENGSTELSSLSQLKKAVQEVPTQQTPMQETDNHLIVPLRNVEMALCGSAEGKALAQAEAAGLKQKNEELERSKNLGFLHKAPSSGVCVGESNGREMDRLTNSARLHHDQENGESGGSRERIFPHEVPQGGEPNPPNGCNNNLMRKVKKGLCYVAGGCVKAVLIVVVHEFWSSITSDCFGSSQ